MMLELADDTMAQDSLAAPGRYRNRLRKLAKVAQYGTVGGLYYTGARELYKRRPRFLRDDDDTQLSRGGRGRERLRRIGQGIQRAGKVLLPVAGAALDFVPGASAVKGTAKAAQRLAKLRQGVQTANRLIAVRQSASPEVQQQAAEVNAEANEMARTSDTAVTPTPQPKGIAGIPPIALIGGAALLFLALKK